MKNSQKNSKKILENKQGGNVKQQKKDDKKQLQVKHEQKNKIDILICELYQLNSIEQFQTLYRKIIKRETKTEIERDGERERKNNCAKDKIRKVKIEI